MKNKKMIISPVLACIFILWIIWGNVSVGVTHYTVLDNNIPTAFAHHKIAVSLAEELVQIAPCYYVTGNRDGGAGVSVGVCSRIKNGFGGHCIETYDQTDGLFRR